MSLLDQNVINQLNGIGTSSILDLKFEVDFICGRSGIAIEEAKYSDRSTRSKFDSIANEVH